MFFWLGRPARAAAVFCFRERDSCTPSFSPRKKKGEKKAPEGVPPQESPKTRPRFLLVDMRVPAENGGPPPGWDSTMGHLLPLSASVSWRETHWRDAAALRVGGIWCN